MEMITYAVMQRSPAKKKKFKAKMGLEPMTCEIVLHTATPSELSTGEKPIRVMCKCLFRASFNHARSPAGFSPWTHSIQHPHRRHHRHLHGERSGTLRRRRGNPCQGERHQCCGKSCRKRPSNVSWWDQNGLISNHKKCEAMLIVSKDAVKSTRPLQVVLDGKPMKQSGYFKYLGIYIDHCLTWSKHVTYIQSRVYPKLKLLNRISSFLSRDFLPRIYKQTLLPLLDYGCVVWGECSKENAHRLERLQNRATRIMLHADRKTCTQKMRAKFFLLSLYSRRLFIKLQYVYKIIHNINCPKQLSGYLVKRSERDCRSLKDPTLLDLPLVMTKCGQTSFKFSVVSAWNKLPVELRELRTLALFKVRTFPYLMNIDRANHICKNNA